MNILAIETTGKIGSVCVVANNEKRTKFMNEPMNHLKLLADLIDRTLKECALQIGDIDLIAVSRGPGSFTGIRIGVATARAISQVTEKKIVSVPTLESFTCNMSKRSGVCVPMFDARRNQIYSAAFIGDKQLIEEGCYMIDEYLNQLKDVMIKNKIDEKIVFFADAEKFSGFCEDILGNSGIDYSFEQGDDKHASAASIAVLGEKIFRDRGAMPYPEVLPEYLRKSEAETKLELKKSSGAI